MTLSILGAGAFGTALAISLAQSHREVFLWSRRPGVITKDGSQRSLRLQEFPIPDNVKPTQDIGISCQSEVILLAIPVQSARGFLIENSQTLSGKTIIACCKGVETTTGKTPCEIIEDCVPGAQAAMLSGPGFAADIAALKPTAMSVATQDIALANRLQEVLITPTLRIYATDDRKGVEIGGALKNVIALACGITEGAGFGESAKAALIARGFPEMQAYAKHYGARSETLIGLSGVGDLFLTCGSSTSRNFRQGLEIGQNGGRYQPTDRTVEGIATARALNRWANETSTELPIIETVAAVLEQKTTLDKAIKRLLDRPLKNETP